MHVVMRFALCSFPRTVLAAIHNLFAGNLYAPASIHLLEFNDEANTLTQIRTFAADAPHGWIQLDYQRNNIYGSSLTVARIANYDVTNPTRLKLTGTVHTGGGSKDKTEAYVQPMDKEPYYVFAASWPSPNGSGISLSVHPNGTLDRLVDSWNYDRTSGIHGLAVGGYGAQQLLYSADLDGDRIWTHAIDATTGKVTELGRLKAKKTGMHPRHLTAHPKGTHLYVVMEAENSLHQFRLDGEGVAAEDSESYSLIPTGEQSANYWSANVMHSPSGRYLWATSRGQRGTKYNAYVSCFLLGDDGAIVKKMFMIASSSGGVTSNAITPAFWSDEYAVFTEATNGKIDILKLGGSTTGKQGLEYKTADRVATLTISDGGCCANAVWYS